MANKAKQVVEFATQETAISSLKDGAFKQAAAAKTLEDVAQYAIAHISGFPENVPDEAKDELYEGYRLKFDGLHPAKMYAVINDHIVEATQDHINAKNVEKMEIGVAYALSYTAQEYGKLANSRPELYKLVKPIREKCSTYCSNRLNDLKRAAKKILSEGQDRKRETLFFKESMDKVFETQEKSVKVKQDRKDATADLAKYRLAVKAFWDTYNR